MDRYRGFVYISNRNGQMKRREKVREGEREIDTVQLIQ